MACHLRANAASNLTDCLLGIDWNWGDSRMEIVRDLWTVVAGNPLIWVVIGLFVVGFLALFVKSQITRHWVDMTREGWADNSKVQKMTDYCSNVIFVCLLAIVAFGFFIFPHNGESYKNFETRLDDQQEEIRRIKARLGIAHIEDLENRMQIDANQTPTEQLSYLNRFEKENPDGSK